MRIMTQPHESYQQWTSPEALELAEANCAFIDELMELEGPAAPSDGYKVPLTLLVSEANFKTFGTLASDEGGMNLDNCAMLDVVYKRFGADAQTPLVTGAIEDIGSFWVKYEIVERPIGGNWTIAEVTVRDETVSIDSEGKETRRLLADTTDVWLCRGGFNSDNPEQDL